MSKFGMKAKMACAVGLMMAGALAILAFFLDGYFELKLRSNIADQQFALVATLAEEIDQKILLAQHDLSFFAESFPDALFTEPARLQNYLKEHNAHEPIFDSGLFVFSPGGVVLATVPDAGLVGKDLSYRPYLHETIASGKPQISAPFASTQEHGHPIVMFTAPRFGPNGEVVAIFGGAIDLLQENFLGRFGQIRLGKTGYFYLYATDRTIIVHPDRRRILNRDVPPGANRLFDAAIAGFEGTEETVTSYGLRTFSSFKKLRSRDWILAGNLPEAEAFEPIFEVRSAILWTLAVGILLSLAATWHLMHLLLAPLAIFTDRIRQMTADEDKRVPIELNTYDEIGALAAAFNTLLAETLNRKEALQDSLLFHQVLINTLPVPVFYKDLEGKYLGCNTAFENFLGRRKEEFLGRTAETLFPADRHRQVDGELFGKTPPKIYETQAIPADGTSHDILVFKAPFTASNGEPAGRIGALLDISDRKKNERALAEQKEFYENLLENSPVAVFVLDREHRVLLWSRACAELTGVGAAEVVGTTEHWRAFYPQQRPCLADLILAGREARDAADLYSQLETSKITPEGLQAEDWFSSLGGEKRYLSFHATPIRNRRGEMIAAVETLQDLSERKRMEQELLRSRDFYLTIFEEFPALIWRAGIDAQCDFFNKTWLEFTGRTLQQEVGNGWAEGVHPDDLQRCLDVYLEAFRARHPFAMEYRLRRHDGQYRWMLGIGRPFRDLENRFAGYIGSLLDITDRREALEKLKIFSRTTEQSSSSIIITDIQGRIEYVNPAFSRLTGYCLQEVAGKTPRLLQSGATSASEYRQIRQTIAAGRVWQGDFLNRKKNGETYWAAATISPILNEKGETTHLVSIQEDVTEQKTLQESAYRRRLLSDAATEALHAFLRTQSLAETAGILVECCAGLLRAETGFIAENGASPKMLALTAPNVDPQKQPLLESRLLALVEGLDAGGEFPAHAAEAPASNVLLIPLQIANDTVGVIGLLDKPGGFTELDRQDMKEFAPTAALIFQGIRSEQARQQTADHLRTVQKFEAIGQLAGGVAHDFNNLLTVINGYTSMLIRALEKDEENRHDAETVLEAGQKAENLTRQLLAFSRKQVLKPVVLNLNELIGNFRKILLRLVREDIEVSWSPTENLGLVKADPGQIEQILINLVVNARDAMPTGGRLEIATAEATLDEDFARLIMGAVHFGHYAMITVKDTGIGMAKEVRERIFDPFFTTKEPGRGTGLGLSTVYGIVKQSGGYITADSTPGKGSEFRIYLPLTEDAPAADKEDINRSRLPAASETILLVEDEEAVLALIAKLLRRQGFTVIAANRPAEALQLAEGARIDLLLTDMVMPGLSGSALAARLREEIPGLKVLFMSGYGEFHGRTTMEDVEQFIQKPFSPTSLLDKIFEILGRNGRRSPANNGSETGAHFSNALETKG